MSEHRWKNPPIFVAPHMPEQTVRGLWYRPLCVRLYDQLTDDLRQLHIRRRQLRRFARQVDDALRRWPSRDLATLRVLCARVDDRMVERAHTLLAQRKAAVLRIFDQGHEGGWLPEWLKRHPRSVQRKRATSTGS